MAKEGLFAVDFFDIQLSSFQEERLGWSTISTIDCLFPFTRELRMPCSMGHDRPRKLEVGGYAAATNLYLRFFVCNLD